MNWAGRISALTSALNKEIALLENALMEAKDAQNAQDEAVNYHQLVLPAMQALRCTADQLETLVAEEYWPFPTYGQLAFRRIRRAPDSPASKRIPPPGKISARRRNIRLLN